MAQTDNIKKIKQLIELEEKHNARETPKVEKRIIKPTCFFCFKKISKPLKFTIDHGYLKIVCPSCLKEINDALEIHNPKPPTNT